MTVRFSTRCPNSDYLGFETSPEAIVAAAKKAEEVGFDAIFVNDHIIVDSSSRAAPWTNVYDPFVAMSFIAAHTTRIGVGVSVLIMPYRNPVATAKSLATIDRMSGGRLICRCRRRLERGRVCRARCAVPRAGRAHQRIYCTKNLLEIKTAPSRVRRERALRSYRKAVRYFRLRWGGVRICSHWITIQFLRQRNRYHETRTNRPTVWSQ